MNIFVLDVDPQRAAEAHVDKHVVKMPLESAQMLCAARRLVGSKSEPRYKLTHKGHPCTLWVCDSLQNYRWLSELGLAICREYTHRYDKIHACEAVIGECIADPPDFDRQGMTDFAQAMPDEYKRESAVEAYREYYRCNKLHLHSWTLRDTPEWL